LAVVAAISVDRGIDCVMIFDEAVKTETFIQFIETLRQGNGNRHLNVFLDNLAVHRTTEVKEAYDKNNIQAIYNVPYRYDFNPIELVFSQVKRVFRKAKLNAFINDKPFDYKAEIHKAFSAVSKQTVANCIRHSTEIITKINSN